MEASRCIPCAEGEQPAGPPCEVDEELRISDWIGAERDHRFVAEELTLAVDPSDEPGHERVEEKGNPGDLLHQLDPVVAMNKVRELVEDARPAIKMRPGTPVGGDEDERLALPK